MKMGARGAAGSACESDFLPLPNKIPLLHQHLVKVGISHHIALGGPNPQEISVVDIVSRFGNFAGSKGGGFGVLGDGNIKSVVEGLLSRNRVGAASKLRAYLSENGVYPFSVVVSEGISMGFG